VPVRRRAAGATTVAIGNHCEGSACESPSPHPHPDLVRRGGWSVGGFALDRHFNGYDIRTIHELICNSDVATTIIYARPEQRRAEPGRPALRVCPAHPPSSQL
jgi:hypothetical protein